MNLEEQRDYFERKREQAYQRRLHRVKDPEYRQMVIAEARRRLREGFDLYGDSGWHMTHQELVQNELQEDADALLYQVFRMNQGWPT